MKLQRVIGFFVCFEHRYGVVFQFYRFSDFAFHMDSSFSSFIRYIGFLTFGLYRRGRK
jgi:hypothetical protein